MGKGFLTVVLGILASSAFAIPKDLYVRVGVERCIVQDFKTTITDYYQVDSKRIVETRLYKTTQVMITGRKLGTAQLMVKTAVDNDFRNVYVHVLPEVLGNNPALSLPVGQGSSINLEGTIASLTVVPNDVFEANVHPSAQETIALKAKRAGQAWCEVTLGDGTTKKYLLEAYVP